MKSFNEELCKSRFENFLKGSSTTGPLSWEDGGEPPDYYLTIDGIRYAVEVTIVMETLEVGTSTMSTKAVMASLGNFVDEVELIARKQSILHGTYVVLFSKPITNFRDVKDTIRNALLAYIESTQVLGKAPQQVIFKRGRQTCSIEKIHSQADRIHKPGPTNGKREGDAALEICELLKNKLDEKLYKLRNVQPPKIVLLYDAYLFADPSMYRDCTSVLSSLFDSFHTVFIVHGNNQDFTLYSQNPGWLQMKAA